MEREREVHIPAREPASELQPTTTVVSTLSARQRSARRDAPAAAAAAAARRSIHQSHCTVNILYNPFYDTSQYVPYVESRTAGAAARCAVLQCPPVLAKKIPNVDKNLIGSRPSDHYFRSVCLFVCLFVCAEFFSAVFDPISIKLGHMLYVWV